MKKAIKTALAALILTGTSYGVYAACGDSVCGWQSGNFVCYAKTPGGGTATYTVDDPCVINCG